MKKWFLLLSLLLPITIEAQNHKTQNEYVITTDSITVYFRLGKSNLDLDFKGNFDRLDQMTGEISKLLENDPNLDPIISVSSGASPEGSASLNKALSVDRAESIIRYLERNTPLSRNNFNIKAVGVDWDGLIRQVRQSNMPYKDEILYILTKTPECVMEKGKVVYKRQNRIKSFEGGEAYRWMSKYMFPKIRHTSVVIERSSLVKKEVVQVVDTVVSKDTVVMMPPEKPNLYWSVKTNALYDVMAVPNIGVEFYLKDNWSIAGNWMYAWWKSDTKHRYWRIYGGDVAARKWLGDRTNMKPLTGHHVGVYLQGLTYDVEFGGKGYQADKWNFGGGIEYGFALPIAKRINFDFNICVGYFGGKLKKYNVVNDRYQWQEDKRLNWVGPTKLEASLVILLGRGNENK